MSLRKTLVLLVILCGVLLYIFKYEVPRIEQEKLGELLLGNISKDSIESVEITGSDSEKILIKNREPKNDKVEADNKKKSTTSVDVKDWELGDVPGSKLDPGALNTLLTSLVDLKLDSSIPSEDVDKDLSVYGLVDPAIKVKVLLVGGKEKDLSFGKMNDYVKKRYLKLGDSNKLFLISDSAFSAANKTKIEFRDRTPVDFIDSELASITISEKGQVALELTKGNDYKWKITKPINATASDSAFSEFTREIRNLKAEEFLDTTSAKDKINFDNSNMELKLVYNDTSKTPLEIKFTKKILSDTQLKNGAKEEQNYFFISNTPSIYRSAIDLVPAFQKDVNFFREKQLAKFVVDDVMEANFKDDSGTETKIERSGESWIVNGKTGDDAFVRELFSSISGMSAVDFPETAKDFGFNSPRLDINLKIQGIAAGELNNLRVVIGHKLDNADRYYVGVGDLTEPFIIGEDTLRKIMPREEVLLKPETTPSPVPTKPV